MEERIITQNDEIIVNTLAALRKSNRQASSLMEGYKPILHGERLMTDGELAAYLRVGQRA